MSCWCDSTLQTSSIPSIAGGSSPEGAPPQSAVVPPVVSFVSHFVHVFKDRPRDRSIQPVLQTPLHSSVDATSSSLSVDSFAGTTSAAPVVSAAWLCCGCQVDLVGVSL
jgi:hypothetical protein